MGWLSLVRRHPATTPTRRARATVGTVIAVALAVTVAPASPADAQDGETGVQASGAHGGLRARRSMLIVQAAELTDRVEASRAAVVAAQMSSARTAGNLATMRGRMRERAVTAYMRGTRASIAEMAAPRAYLEVVAVKERSLVAGYRQALAGAAAEQQQAEAAGGDLRAAQLQLNRITADLETAIVADDAMRADRARLADERRRADDARRAALAREAAALAAARGRARAAASAPDSPGSPGLPGGYSPSPLDPGALVPRHRVATQRQLELMGRIPFGPLAAGAALPAGLVITGHRVEGGASWYGPGFNGRPTASGAIYDQEAWTVASRDLPLGTFLSVTRGDRRVLLLVNDRGPYVGDRVLDLSAAAARFLGVGGVAPVSAEVVAAA